MEITNLLQELLKGLSGFTIGNAIMMLIGGILILLAVVKEYEPVLLLPIGFGCLLANIPATGMDNPGGLFDVLYKAGISTELFPLLIFVGVGAMIDFSPLLAQPKMVLLGAAGQFGIFGTMMLATLIGFNLNEAASIGIIGAIDGPTSIFVATKLAPHLLAPIAVAAYSYMSLVPIIQPPLMRLMTTKAERRVRMVYAPRPISKRTRVLFPIVVTLVVGLLTPDATPLISMLMLGQPAARKRRGRTLEQSRPKRDRQHCHAVPGFDHRFDDERPQFFELADDPDHDPGAAGIRSGYRCRPALWQADVLCHTRRDQSIDRRSRHQRLSDGRTAGGAGGAGRRF